MRKEMNEVMMAQVNGCGFIGDMKKVIKVTEEDPNVWKDALNEVIENPVDSVKGAWKTFKGWF